MTNDIRNKSDLTVFIIQFLEIYLSGLYELKESMNSTIDIYLSLKKKIDEHITHKYKVFMKFLLEVTLFGPSHGVSMAHIVKVTLKTEQSLRSHIKEINKEHPFIDIDKSHKPYMYKMNIDILSLL